MAVGEKKFTAQEVNKLVQKRLGRLKAKVADYDRIKTEHAAMKAENDALKTENADLKTKVADQGGKLKDSQKAEIAKAAGLPEGLASRLQGETKEALEADAKKLAESLGPGPKVGDGTNPPTGAKKPYTRADIKRMTPEEITANWDQIKSQLKDGSLNKA